MMTCCSVFAAPDPPPGWARLPPGGANHCSTTGHRLVADALVAPPRFGGQCPLSWRENRVGSRSYIVALGLAGVTVVATAGVAVAHTQALNDWPYATHTGQATTYTLAAVGDIACEPDDVENAGT